MTKIYKFKKFTEISDEKQAIKDSLNIISKDRENKRSEVKKCTTEINKLKKKLKNRMGKIK